MLHNSHVNMTFKDCYQDGPSGTNIVDGKGKTFIARFIASYQVHWSL